LERCGQQSELEEHAFEYVPYVPRYVAFLRGINVGGNKLVPMAQLKSLFEDLGFSDVRTLLQSGNVVFTANASSSLERKCQTEFSNCFGFSSDFVMRSAAEFAKIVASNPFLKEAKEDPGHLLVMFLKEPAPASAFSAFLKKHSGPEIVKLKNRELFIYYPDGVGRSKLKIPFNGTARNWNTVLKVAALLRAE